MLLWRTLPGTEMPSSVSSRLAVRNGSSGRFWRQKVLRPARCRLLRCPPAQVKAFAQSRGTRAKSDRIDAELIARFFAFRPEAGRSLPAEKIRLLRALTSKRALLVEMRKRLLV